MVLIYWITAICSLIISRGAEALESQEPEGCPKLNLAKLPSILGGCPDQSGLEKCVVGNFDSQYSFCRTCLIVNEQNLDDSNNCLCVQCAMKALATDCHAEHCAGSAGGTLAGKKEPDFINRIIRGFDTDSVTHFELESTVTDSEINYFADTAGKVYRNLLAGEKGTLVHSIVEKLKQSDPQNVENVKPFGFLKKKKTSFSWLPSTPAPTSPSTTLPSSKTSSPCPKKHYSKPTDEDDEDDDDKWETSSTNPLVYTKTKLYTTYTPKKKTLTKWHPKIISKTIVIDQCSDMRTTTTVVATATDTEYETIYKPIYKMKTTTEYDTVWSGTTTKVKHTVETETETDYKLVTKTKYRNDITTETETEVEETTKYIKVGKITVTDTETDRKVKWKTRTITAGSPSITTATATATKTTTQISIITNHDRTRTRVRTRTVTRTKKIWNPRHTTTERLTLSLGALGINEVSQDSNDRFGMFRVDDNPAPLLASKRVVKVHHGNSSNYSTSTIAVPPQSSSFVQSQSTSSDGIIIGVSSAPQAATAMLVYTTLAVSLATSMMLAFSYHTNISLGDGSDESAEHPSSDDENNDWSDAEDVELTNSEIESLAVEVPRSGLAPKEMAQKLAEENPINLLMD